MKSTSSDLYRFASLMSLGARICANAMRSTAAQLIRLEPQFANLTALIEHQARLETLNELSAQVQTIARLGAQDQVRLVWDGHSVARRYPKRVYPVVMVNDAGFGPVVAYERWTAAARRKYARHKFRCLLARKNGSGEKSYQQGFDTIPASRVARPDHVNCVCAKCARRNLHILQT